MMTDPDEVCPLCCEPYTTANNSSNANDTATTEADDTAIQAPITCAAPSGCQSFVMCRLCVYRQSLHLSSPFVYDDDTGDFCSIDPTFCPQCKRTKAFNEGDLFPLSDEVKETEKEEVRKRTQAAIERERERGLRTLRDAPPVVISTNTNGNNATEGMENIISWKRLISADGQSVCIENTDENAALFQFHKLSTIGVPELFRTTGTLYYEIEIVQFIHEQPNLHCLYFGFSLVNGVEINNTATCNESSGVGDNARTWGFNGETGFKCHMANQFGDYRLAPKWKPGDVIGVAANLDTGMIAVSRDGNWDLEGGFGVKFEDASIKLGVYPCIQAFGYSLKTKVGEDVKYRPPESVWEGWAKYEDFTWVGLPEDARAAAITLGYTQQTWGDDGKNPIEYKIWDDLTTDEQNACKVLGYNNRMWSQLTSIWNRMDEDNGSESEGSQDSNSDNDSTSSEDTSENGFMNMPWASLPNDARQAAETLQYTPELWDARIDAPQEVVDACANTLDDKDWSFLTHEEQRAAILLGYDKKSWNEEVHDDSSFESQSDTFDHFHWSDLPEHVKQAAAFLGYDRRSWNNDLEIPLEEKEWHELTLEQQSAARILFYSEDNWKSS